MNRVSAARLGSHRAVLCPASSQPPVPPMMDKRLLPAHSNMNESQHTIGIEKVSVVITRKTTGDLLVSQHSSERWFRSEQAARNAMEQIMSVFIEAEPGETAEPE